MGTKQAMDYTLGEQSGIWKALFRKSAMASVQVPRGIALPRLQGR